MCFVIEFVEFLKPSLKPSIFWENRMKPTFSGCPQKCYHRVMYTASSSCHKLVNLNLPFELILRMFEVVFWCLEWECSTFWKIGGNFIQVHQYQYYTMVLCHRIAFNSSAGTIDMHFCHTGWPKKNGTGYFPQYVFSRAHLVRQCRGPQFFLFSLN